MRRLVVACLLAMVLAAPLHALPTLDEDAGWQEPAGLGPGDPLWEGSTLRFPFEGAPLASLRVSFPQDDVVRLVFTPTGSPEPPAPIDGVRPSVSEHGGTFRIRTQSLTLEVDRGPFQWRLSRHGEVVTAGGAPPVLVDESASWKSGFAPAYETRLVRASLTVEPGTHFFGFGQRFNSVDQSGFRIRSWICDCLQDGSYADKGDGYYVVPFFWTERGWGGFLDSTADVEWDVAATRSDEITATDPSGGPFDLYLIAPGSPREVFDRYTDLVGKPSLPPRWSFEQWVDGVYGTEDGTIRGGEAAMRAYLDAFEANDIPVRSVVVEDWTTLWWFGARWQWNPSMFPDPAGFVDELKSKGLKVMLWETPAVSPANTEWPEGAARGVFAKDDAGLPYVIQNENSGALTWWMQGVSIVDFTNPEALTWWREKHEPLLALGIDGYKADGGEEVTPDMVFWNGEEGIVAHNANARRYNAALYEDLVDARGEGAMISRSGTVGSQLASGIWNGDQGSGLGWTRRNLAAGLGASNSGLYWWTFDMGGLTGTMTREEMLRNLQVNVVSPWFKSHVTWDHPRPPWDYDEGAIATYRYYTNLRLALLDYLFNEASKSAETGVPLTRILAVDYPEDARAVAEWTEFLVGDQLLAAPVVYAGVTERDIHLPRGSWLDLASGSVYHGPLTLKGYDVPQELLPLFWRLEGDFDAPLLPPHPGLDATWAPNATIDRPDTRDAVDETFHASGRIVGPVVAGQAATGESGVSVPFPVHAAPRGEGWVLVRWNPGPAFGWMQENFLNVRIRDAAGNVVRECGGSQALCRIDDWENVGEWRVEASAWTGHEIDWSMTIHVPY